MKILVAACAIAILLAGCESKFSSTKSGEITLEDVYRFFPVPYNVATGSVKGALS